MINEFKVDFDVFDIEEINIEKDFDFGALERFISASRYFGMRQHFNVLSKGPLWSNYNV